MYDEPHFYFVHSYHAMPEHEEDQWLTAYYGIDFTAGICRENIMGVQFHPEKSHKYGMKLLDNYVKYF
jgi:glutamine amidotransferase